MRHKLLQNARSKQQRNIKPPKKNGVGIWALIIILILLSPDTYTVGNSSRIFCGSDNIGILCIFPFAFCSGVSMWLGGAGMILKMRFLHHAGICEYGYDK